MSYREISLNALWKNNPALALLPGLCPLLGVSNSVVNTLERALGRILGRALEWALGRALRLGLEPEYADRNRSSLFEEEAENRRNASP